MSERELEDSVLWHGYGRLKSTLEFGLLEVEGFYQQTHEGYRLLYKRIYDLEKEIERLKNE